MHHLGMKHKHQREAGTVTSPAKESSLWIRALDKTTFVAGILGPFTVVPQAWEIFTTHQAGGVSAIAWLLLFIVTLPWVFYGFAHKDKTIIASFILWEIMNLVVFVGAVMYG